VRILLTGMSGAGKSTVVQELRRRGFPAYDADDHGFSEPAADGAWEWDVERVRALLEAADGVLFFAGTCEAQGTLPFDRVVLLTVPAPVLLERLRTRRTSSYGKDPAELARVLEHVETVEPLLRRSADLVVDTRQPLDRVVAAVLELIG
jgi:dephospho-CoA kinase